MRATPRWVPLRTRRGGEERVKSEGFDDEWLLMGVGAVGKKGEINDPEMKEEKGGAEELVKF